MIILNEKECAENCLKNKVVINNIFYTLTTLAKYYYYCYGYRKAKITILLTDFITKCYPDYSYNKLSWDDTIEKIAANAGKYKLYEIDGVWITKSELERIDSINNIDMELLAFTMLCLAKLNNIKNPKNNGWVNNDAKEVFDLARVSSDMKGRYMKFNDMHNIGLLEFAKRIDNLSVRVTYVDNDSNNILFISDFRELGYEYLNYKGGLFCRCKECGILFRDSKSHPRTYCNDCQPRSKKVVETKWIVCEDCGKEFEVSIKNNRAKRCNDCQSIRNAELNRLSSRKRMEKHRSNQVE